jgi:hypothetical protein
MRRSVWLISLALFCVVACAGPGRDSAKTTFQTSQGWRPTLDNRADAVMVYGVGGNPSDKAKPGSVESRLASWRERGYETHFMTGIAWGGYQDYFTGAWDGAWHLDEGQVRMAGDTIWHGRMVPYIVPTENYLAYFKERIIKRVIDAGVDDIFLEEPEFWADAGYSEAFQREWQDFYGEPWRPQDESPEATYLSSKLKYHLYYRALETVCSYAKSYGRSLGREIRCYVPTHSLLNYSMWQIVSPEASLASMDCIDGYIAQVWTGTSRAPDYYGGVYRERVFETAYLEYGCMASMTAPTGRRVWFLTDPIEDATRDWQDFKRNYQATFTAQLLYPQIADYEIMPWPERIYERPYPAGLGSEERIRIPADFSAMMQVMVNALHEMPVSRSVLNGSQGLSVLMANSLMFQRFPIHDGYDDPQLSNFFGLAMPLVKRGVPVGITHIENLGYPDALADVRLLLMTYSNMKPMDPSAHAHLADWVRTGGVLLYSATDTDPFQSVHEWWNSDGLSYAAPADHLFELLGVEPGAGEGVYDCGKGKLCVLRHDPKEYVLAAGGENMLIDAVEALYGPLEFKNHFVLDRGPYKLAAALDESVSDEPYVLEGLFIDLFDPMLPIVTRKEVTPGSQAFLYDLRKAPKAPAILAVSSHAYDLQRSHHAFSYTCKSPIDTDNVTRIRLRREPLSVEVDGIPAPASAWSWDPAGHTLFLRFPNNPDGVRVDIRW